MRPEDFIKSMSGLEKDDLIEIINILSKPKAEPERGAENLFPTKADGFFFRFEQKDKNGNFKTAYSPDYHGLGDYLCNILNFRTMGGHSMSWTGTHYKTICDLEFQKFIDEIIRKNQPPNIIINFLKVAKIKCCGIIPDTPDGKINLANGVLDARTGKMESHNPALGFTYCLDHGYSADAECPEFVRYLDFVMRGDQELIDIVQLMLGYILIGGLPKAHKAFCLYGGGSNGKSTLIYIINQLFGQKNMSAIPMSLIDKPFSLVQAYGKLANMSDETPKSNINAEIFKNIVSGGMVTAAYKGKDEFNFPFKARLIFACNDLPNFGDTSHGNRRRIIFIPFEVEIGNGAEDTDIYRRLDAEMPGILNFAVAGAQKIMALDFKFPVAKRSLEIMEQFKEETDNVYRFLKENAVMYDGPSAMDFFLATDDFYSSYASWAKSRNINVCGDHTFRKRANAFWKELYQQNGLEFKPNGRSARCKTEDGWFRGVRGVKLRAGATSLDFNALFQKRYARQENMEND